MNSVNLIGRLTKDSEMRFTPNKGTAVTSFTIAVNNPYKKDESDFIRCYAFGKTAEVIAQHTAKGHRVAITGHIKTSSYDAQDGIKRYATDIVVDRFEFLEKSTKSKNDMTPVDDGDIPF